MTRRASFVFALLVAFWAGLAGASGRDEEIAALRARLAEFGRMEIERDGRTGPEALAPEFRQKWSRSFYGLQKEPLDLLLPAIDACLRGGDAGEIIGASGIYFPLVYDKKTPADPAYKPLLLDLLARDDLKDPVYTDSVAGLLRFYPSRESVAAAMALAERSPTRQRRVDNILATAGLLGMHLEIYTNSTEEEVDRAVAEFEAWYEKNRDRIEFDQDGDLRLSRGKQAREEKRRLDAADRARIRDDAACILRLLDLALGETAGEPGEAGVLDLNARCGPVLFGEERSALLGKALEQAASGAGHPLDLQAELQGSASYPTADAALLAAIYAVSFESDPETIRLAEEALARSSRPEIRRVAKGEPAPVRKKAESLAGRTRERE